MIPAIQQEWRRSVERERDQQQRLTKIRIRRYSRNGERSTRLMRTGYTTHYILTWLECIIIMSCGVPTAFATTRIIRGRSTEAVGERRDSCGYGHSPGARSVCPGKSTYRAWPTGMTVLPPFFCVRDYASLKSTLNMFVQVKNLSELS